MPKAHQTDSGSPSLDKLRALILDGLSPEARKMAEESEGQGQNLPWVHVTTKADAQRMGEALQKLVEGR